MPTLYLINNSPNAKWVLFPPQFFVAPHLHIIFSETLFPQQKRRNLCPLPQLFQINKRKVPPQASSSTHTSWLCEVSFFSLHIADYECYRGGKQRTFCWQRWANHFPVWLFFRPSLRWLYEEASIKVQNNKDEHIVSSEPRVKLWGSWSSGKTKGSSQVGVQLFVLEAQHPRHPEVWNVSWSSFYQGEEEREPLLEEQYTSQTRKGEHGGRHFLKIKEHKRQWMRGKSTKERSFFYAGSWTQLLPQCVSESRQKRKGGKTVQSRPVPGVTGSGRGGHAAAREWPLQKQIVI